MGNDNSKERAEKAEEYSRKLERQLKEFTEYVREQQAKEDKRGEKEKNYERQRQREQEMEAERQRQQEIEDERERQRQQKIEAERQKQREQQMLNDLTERRTMISHQMPGGSLDVPDPDITFPKVLNVGLYGTTGIGKTSLINSIRYALEGKLDRMKWLQTSTEEFQGGHTIRRMRRLLTDHLAIIDNRGIGVEDLIGDGATQELIKQLEGRGRYADVIDWKTPTEATLQRKSIEANRIYCTLLVFDSRIMKEVFKYIKAFIQQIYSWQGRYPIAIITNVDRASEVQVNNTRILLRSMGISDIFEIANLHEGKIELEIHYQITLLKVLQKCMFDGDEVFLLRKEIEEDDD